MRFKFVDAVTGDELSESKVIEELDRSRDELIRLLGEVERFRSRLNERCLGEGDEFLSFESVLENGYDRTGPNLVVVLKREGGTRG